MLFLPSLFQNSVQLSTPMVLFSPLVYTTNSAFPTSSLTGSGLGPFFVGSCDLAESKLPLSWAFPLNARTFFHPFLFFTSTAVPSQVDTFSIRDGVSPPFARLPLSKSPFLPASRVWKKIEGLLVSLDLSPPYSPLKAVGNPFLRHRRPEPGFYFLPGSPENLSFFPAMGAGS